MFAKQWPSVRSRLSQLGWSDPELDALSLLMGDRLLLNHDNNLTINGKLFVGDSVVIDGTTLTIGNTTIDGGSGGGTVTSDLYAATQWTSPVSFPYDPAALNTWSDTLVLGDTNTNSNVNQLRAAALNSSGTEPGVAAGFITNVKGIYSLAATLNLTSATDAGDDPTHAIASLWNGGNGGAGFSLLGNATSASINTGQSTTLSISAIGIATQGNGVDFNTYSSFGLMTGWDGASVSITSATWSVTSGTFVCRLLART